MKTQAPNKKLKLARVTLLTLSSGALGQVAGGISDSGGSCTRTCGPACSVGICRPVTQ